MKNKWMTTTEAARLLGLKPATVSAYCQRGSLRGELVGRVWRVNAASVAEYQRRMREAVK